MHARIGITTSYEDGEQRLNHAYVQAVERAGGLPLIVPMLESEEANEALANQLAALVITGGPAITTGLIGSLPEDLSPTDPTRVQADLGILKAFINARKPVLGICYGMQLLNACSGGTIYGDVQQAIQGALAHSNKRGAEGHSINIEPQSRLRGIINAETAWVNTRHIQAIAALGSGFKVAATSPDGVIEAIENDDGSVLGVQFHPERMDEMLPLFEDLVHRAKQKQPQGVSIA
jgi:putative glutamine amidotransferase